MKLKIDCPYCSRMRTPDMHLHELGLACEYLDNTAQYKGSENQRIVRTKTIGEWLKLAGQLEEVKVDSWRFEKDSGFCEVLADRVSSDSKHFTLYSTALTRFLFVMNALEETYRFVEHYYPDVASSEDIPERMRPKSVAIRAAYLVDRLTVNSLPIHLVHRAEQYQRLFSEYLSNYKLELSGMQYALEAMPGFCLHLIRNLRNHVAHGIFPLVPNPDYTWGSDFNRDELIVLLGHSCRLAALYVQALLANYNQGFKSEEYLQCNGASGPEFEYFLQNCTPTYLRNLHMQQAFSLASAFDYESEPWEGE